MPKPAQAKKPAKKQAKKQATKTARNRGRANYFELKRGGTRITYTESDIVGRPQINYDDGKRQLTFTGDQIEQSEASIGSILTVELKVVLDGDTEALTLLIPQVNLPDGEPVKFKTVVIFTRIRGSIAGPGLIEGQVQSYTAQTFRGTASFVLS
ncbi:MAG TPA: hypothetical protein VGG03_00915 [Thermoanaerobaculia bacterium]|jgi:hypothetical protein